LLPNTGASSEQFGYAVSLDRDNAVVGAPFADGNGVDSGAAFLFARNAGGTNQWNQTETFTPNLLAANGTFGYSLAVDRNTLVVGAPFDATDNGTKYGSMYIFRLKFNNAPTVVNPILDQIAQRDSLFTFTVPLGTFDDPDVAEVLIYSAATAPSSALPVWLSFDPITRTFSGTPGVSNMGPVSIALKVTDEDDETATDVFVINVSATGALELWRIAHFGIALVSDPSKESSVWGDNADPDGDGITNYQEYLNGTDPLGAGSAPPLLLTILRDPLTGIVRLKYLKRSDDSHLVYTLEGSIDGTGWVPAAPQIASESVVPVDASFAEVTCVVLNPQLRVIPALFRVRVSVQP